MSDTKRILVWLFVLVWCVLSLCVDVRAQGTIDLSPLPEFTEQRCSDPVDVAANTIIIKKKAVGSVAAAGAVNNVALVADSIVGTDNCDGTFVFDLGAHSFTSGNVLLIGVAFYDTSSAWSAGMITKNGGTATIGSVSLDQSTAVGSETWGTALFRVPITGNGTLLLSITGGQTCTVIGGAEFSNLHATPLSTTSTAAGTGAAHSTGSVATTDVGVMMYVATEGSSGDFVRTYSDQVIYNQPNGSSHFTGFVQYKIINSSPNTLTDTTGATSMDWELSYALYKSN